MQNVLVIHAGAGYLSFERLEVKGENIIGMEKGTDTLGIIDLTQWCMNEIYHKAVPHSNTKLSPQNYRFYRDLFNECKNNLKTFDSRDKIDSEERVCVDILNDKIWETMPGYEEDDESESSSENEISSIRLTDFNCNFESLMDNSQVMKQIVELLNTHQFSCILLQGGLASIPQFKQYLKKATGNENLIVCIKI